MKTLQKITLLFALITLFASCQSNTDSKQLLSNSETREEMIGNIANDSSMSKEMMSAMMTSHTGMAMMEASKNDTTMMSGMCKAMMGNKEMMDMMEKMKGEKKDMKMEGMKH